MALLFEDQTTDDTSSSESLSGPSSVCLTGTLDGAMITLEAASADKPSNFEPIGFAGNLTSGGWIDINIQGSYSLRAKQSRSGESTSVTVVVQQ